MSESLVFNVPLNEGSGNHVYESLTKNEYLINYKYNHLVKDHQKAPVWIRGGFSDCLLFDGYSTFIQLNGENIQYGDVGLTVSTWIIPRSHDSKLNKNLVSIVDHVDENMKNGFLLGTKSNGVWGVMFVNNGEVIDLFSPTKSLELNVICFLTVTLNPLDSKIKLYKNGIKVAEKHIPYLNFSPSKEFIYIGTNSHSREKESPLNISAFNGVIKDLRIHSIALNREEIIEQYSEVKDKYAFIPYMDSELGLSRNRCIEDPHRPIYHMMPQEHWMNEPHAPFFFNGQYHLFYQQNPKGPFWYHIHWGHAVSKDLVHWKDLPTALTPEDEGIDPIGCWSGSATFDEKGLPVIFYTAGNDKMFPNQMTAMAKCKYLVDGDNDLVNWDKHNEIVTVQNEGEGELGNFRDPFIIQNKNEWIQLVGSSLGPEKGGTALVYTSKNLIEWTYKGPLFQHNYDKYKETGPNWELPVLLPLGVDKKGIQKHIFIQCANEVPNTQVENFYWIGLFDSVNYRFIPDHEEPRLIDIGQGHFTGPSGFVSPDGRTIIFSITQGRRTMEEELTAGWAHNGGLPMELSLKEDNTLRVAPIRELKSLREKKIIDLRDITIEKCNEVISQVKGNTLEIKLSFQVSENNIMGISVRCSKDRIEETQFYYDSHKKYFYVDRTKSCMDEHEFCNGVQGDSISIDKNELHIHMFLDKSMIEAYINSSHSLTTRVYPKLSDSNEMYIIGNDNTIVTNLEIYQLESAYKE